jgi:hypothetical protein
MASPAPQTISDPSSTRVWMSRLGLALITLARYLLGAWMMPYGISKLANLQFQVSAWDYTKPIGELSGKLLTWAFLGYQPWFQFLLGTLETIPALLLMFRRTWRLGALLLFPMILNVTLMNYAMDLWDETKQNSLSMLVLNVILIACCFPAYAQFLKALFPKPKPVQRRWLRITAYVVEILLPIVGLSLFCFQFFTMVNGMMAFDFQGDRQINRAGTWSIERVTVAGHDVAAAGHLYFDFQGRCAYTADGQKMVGKFKSDRAKRTFEISGVPLDGDASAISGAYKVDGDKLLLLGTRSGREVAIVLRRSGWGKILPWK